MFEKLFVPASFFLIRSAAQPQETAEELLAQPDWVRAVLQRYDRERYLQEAVMIASPALDEVSRANNQKGFAAAVFKYALRMAKRATPFGLFSLVIPAGWSERAKADLDEQMIKKRVRPDMAWLLALLQKHCEDERIFPDLLVYWNPLAQRKGERFSLSYLRYPEKDDTHKDKALSIRASKLVTAILDLARTPKTVSVICSELLAQIPQLELEKVQQVIRQLLAQQFLLPSLFPSLLSDSCFNDLAPHLMQSNELALIAQEIATYEKAVLGEGTGQLKGVKNKMRSLATTSDILQVDAYYDGTFSLPSAVGEEICEAAAYLWALSPRRSMGSPIYHYHERFIEKYGTHRTVPILELLDEERGLGPLAKDEKGLLPPLNRFKMEWEQWLFHRWEEAVVRGDKEIVLPQDLPEQLLAKAQEKPADPRDALVSMDLFFKISAPTLREIDEGNYQLEFVQPSWHGGSVLGRFFYLLNDEQKECLRSYYSEEERLEEETLFLEVSCWPQTGKSANVSNHACLRKHRLDLHDQSGKSYSLEDIYVGSTGQRLYLTLREGGKEVVYRVSNFLNVFFMPDFIQLMREVSLTRYQLLHSLSWGLLENKTSFLPRLRYKRTVLSPARWNLDSSLLEGKDWEKKFQAWADQWGLPERSFFIHEDHHLLFDRRHPACLRELEIKIHKRQPLQFFEEIGQSWLKGAKGSYLAEVSLPVVKNPLYARSRTAQPLQYDASSQGLRWKMPGDGWWYLKVYLAETEISTFLKNQVIPLAQAGYQFFFVRYADPLPHLRLRFRADAERSVFETVNLKTSDWIQKGLIRQIAWVPYEREVERYGGAALIDYAEEVFCEDSFHALEEIASTAERSPLLDTLRGLKFLRGFGFSESEMKHILERSGGSTEALAGFRQWKAQLLTGAEAILSQNAQDAAKWDFRSAASQHPGIELYDICSSMLHMHFNRLGCSPFDEERARQYALSVLLQREKRLSAAALSVATK